MTRQLLRITLLTTVLASVFGCGGGSGDGDLTYVALGASDATGIGADPLTNGYVFRIESALDEEGRETDLTNLGIPGAEADEIKDLALPIAREEDPDLVTLFTGGNDIITGESVETFEADLGDILRELREETQAIIVVATLPDFSTSPRFIEDPDPDVTTARINAFNEAILRQAAAYNVAVVDLRGFAVGTDVTAEDGFHPNNEGHSIIAEQFLTVIRAQLASQPS